MLCGAPHVPVLGEVEASALPTSSTPTHIPVDGEDTAEKTLEPSTLVGVQVPAGSVAVMTSPTPPQPTHRLVEGQVTPENPTADAPVLACQALASPAGLADVNAFPVASTATH